MKLGCVQRVRQGATRLCTPQCRSAVLSRNSVKHSRTVVWQIGLHGYGRPYLYVREIARVGRRPATLERVASTPLADVREDRCWEDHIYRYANTVPLVEEEDALKVNWCEVTVTSKKGKLGHGKQHLSSVP